MGLGYCGGVEFAALPLLPCDMVGGRNAPSRGDVRLGVHVAQNPSLMSTITKHSMNILPSFKGSPLGFRQYLDHDISSHPLHR